MKLKKNQFINFYENITFSWTDDSIVTLDRTIGNFRWIAQNAPL